MKDARSLWTAGSKAPAATSAREIAERAAKFERAVRWSHRLEYAAGAFVITFFGAGAALPERFGMPPVSRLGAVAIACGAVFIVTYLALRGRPPEVRRGAPTLAAYRDELAHRRDLLARVPSWYLGPLVPGMVLFLAGQMATFGGPVESPSQLAPVAATIVATFVVIGWLNLREARKLSAKLAELPTAEPGAVDGPEGRS